MGERFALRHAGLDWFEVRSLDDLKARIKDVDALLCSGLWWNELIPAAPKFAFIQSISAGTDQYSRDALDAAGIRVASARGVNDRAVAEQARGRSQRSSGSWRAGRSGRMGCVPFWTSWGSPERG